MKRIALTGLLCLGAALAQDVRFDYDRAANFGAYHTYQWVADGAPGSNQLMDQNIKRAVDSQLAGKGLQRVESGGDLQLAYHTSISQEKEFSAFGTAPRLLGAGRVTTSTIDVGKLSVEMYDPARKQLVWNGAAEKTLDLKKDPDKNYKTLEKAMAKLLKNYPTGAKK